MENMMEDETVMETVMVEYGTDGNRSGEESGKGSRLARIKRCRKRHFFCRFRQ
jgi:hypothetical protein